MVKIDEAGNWIILPRLGPFCLEDDDESSLIWRKWNENDQFDRKKNNLKFCSKKGERWMRKWRENQRKLGQLDCWTKFLVVCHVCCEWKQSEVRKKWWNVHHDDTNQFGESRKEKELGHGSNNKQLDWKLNKISNKKLQCWAVNSEEILASFHHGDDMISDVSHNPRIECRNTVDHYYLCWLLGENRLQGSLVTATGCDENMILWASG